MLRRRVTGLASALVFVVAWAAVSLPVTANAAELSTPHIFGLSHRTETTLSMRFARVAESGGVCQPDIGYEFNRGAGWLDGGTFAASCQKDYAGYRFPGLQPGTSYDLSIRAYRIVDGVRYTSPTSTITGTTLTP